MNLGETAKLLREDFGLTQRATADRLGVSYVHLCNIEKDKSNPSADLMEKYRVVFGVDLYVYSWCLRADLANVPTSMRDATQQMLKQWKKVIVLRKKQFEQKGS